VPDIVPQSVALASSGTGYRERSAGTDYVQFAFTREASREDTGEYLIKTALQLAEGGGQLQWAGLFRVLPAAARLSARPLSLWELEVEDDPGQLAKRLAWWGEQAAVPALLRADSFYTGNTTRPGDAKEHVADFWLAREGHRTVLRMTLNGRLGPYQAYAALSGKPSWLDAARYTALRLEFFNGGLQQCEGCGCQVPANLLDAPWSERFCPRCADEDGGKVIAALAGAGVLQVSDLHTCGGTCGRSEFQRQDSPVRPVLRHLAGHRRG
jgi:hypothetical protein